MLRDRMLNELRKRSEEDYKEFNCKLIPGVPLEWVLGVRVPAVKKLAKRAAKGEFGPPEELLREYEISESAEGGAGGTGLFYEEVLLHGILLGLCAMELPLRMEKIRGFVPRIDNWAVCDTVCSSFKFAEAAENRAEVWEFLQEFLHDGRPAQPQDGREYYIRFGIVMLLAHYTKEAYIDRVLAELYSIRHSGYYVNMAAAWAISVCYIKFPQKTLPYLKNNCTDDFTHNKSIQKIRESLRVSREDKAYLNTLKRK